MSGSEIEGAEGAASRDYLNLLEPPSLIEAFLTDPPAGFRPLRIDLERSTGLEGPAGLEAKALSSGASLPCFLTPFDLLTTLDEAVKRPLRRSPFFKFFERALRLPALFAGSTVSEYLPYPAPSGDIDSLISRLLQEMSRAGARLLILKDIPLRSPLLTGSENRMSERLLESCRQKGFSILSGQALAYVPVDFDSIDAYLARLSYGRRKNLRRKLKSRTSVEIEEVRTGDPALSDEKVRLLFDLYLNVYHQSEIHFDQLTLPFFSSVLRNRAGEGVLFIYRSRGRIIGYNLCFIYKGNLIDKYVGFLYPEAREANLYFLSWFHNLDFALKHRLKFYIAGWTDPEVKAFLGAQFTFTQHAVYFSNPALRLLLKMFAPLFESDRNRIEKEPSVLIDPPEGAG
ncbi:MAG TPA: GNAT family N-acetyltransferase [Candidatus Manganitrophaceae bacterium]|nr:GNAT family N-acetyltransferase [Candidatus Manganitrophaceae bacterium]